MTCREYREDLVEWARGSEPARALAAHVAECAGCARVPGRAAGLECRARTYGGRSDPFARGDRRARDGGVRPRRQKRARLRVWVGSPPEPWPLRRASPCWWRLTGPPPPEAAQFIPIPYTIPLAPEERATVVRMEIPVSALIAAGFQMSATDPGRHRAGRRAGKPGRARPRHPSDFDSEFQLRRIQPMKLFAIATGLSLAATALMGQGGDSQPMTLRFQAATTIGDSVVIQPAVFRGAP